MNYHATVIAAHAKHPTLTVRGLASSLNLPEGTVRSIALKHRLPMPSEHLKKQRDQRVFKCAPYAGKDWD